MKRSDTLIRSWMSVVLLGWAGVLDGQPGHVGVRPWATNVIVPQSRSFGWAPGGPPAIRITGVEAWVIGRDAEVKPARTVEFGTDAFWELVARLAREGRQGSLAFSADVRPSIDGQTVLVRMPKDIQRSGNERDSS